MSTDRELLEMAAKAYWGDEIDDVCSVKWSEAEQAILYTHADNQDHNGQDQEFRWNPLEESHDTFELECRLRLRVTWYGNAVCVCRGDDKGAVEFFAEHGGDEQKARRRAGVRAAAAIGEQMP